MFDWRSDTFAEDSPRNLTDTKKLIIQLEPFDD